MGRAGTGHTCMFCCLAVRIDTSGPAQPGASRSERARRVRRVACEGVQAAMTKAQETLGEMPDLAKVKAAHIQLMRAYVGVLAAASRGERVGIQREYSFTPRLSESWWLVRLLVGTHIRRQLSELGTVYLQLEQAADNDHGGPADAWLRKAREGCLATAERLPKLRLTVVLALAPLVLPLVAWVSKHLGLIGQWLFILVIVYPFGFWLGYKTIRDSYRVKRSLFFPAAGEVDKQPTKKQEERVSNNTYAIEDELFKSVLHRGKKREVQIDKWLWSVGYVLIIEAAALISWRAKLPYWPLLIIAIVVTLIGHFYGKARFWL